MSPIRTIRELLHAKDNYNRISLQSTWCHEGTKEQCLKFDRQRLEYGDSRIQYRSERRRLLSEGLKVCR